MAKVLHPPADPEYLNTFYLEAGLEVLRRLEVNWLRFSTPCRSYMAEWFLPGGWSGGAEEAGGGLAKVLNLQ